MAEKFSGGTARTRNTEFGSDEETGEGESNKKIVSDIRKKYEKKLALQHGGDELVCTKCSLVILVAEMINYCPKHPCFFSRTRTSKKS